MKIKMLLVAMVVAGVAMGDGTISMLTCEPAGGHAVRLRLVVLNAGKTYAGDEAATVSFGNAPLKALSVPLPTSKWEGDHVEVVEMGTVDVSAPCPPEVVVTGGVGAETKVLGRIRRLDQQPGVEFTRAWPGAQPPEGKVKLVLVATYEASEGGTFTVRLACLDCGEELAKDYDMFLHFEPAQTGEDLKPMSALGLYPSVQSTDASEWGPGEVFVTRFGPYSLPAERPERIYLRAGMYDRAGDGSRLAVVSGDASNRAYVGCIVTKGGRTWFERPEVGR
jgi:hypothetical protein